MGRRRKKTEGKGKKEARTKEERRKKEEELERAEQNLYLNRIALGQRDWNDAEVELALQRLDACPEERRGWEWRYLRLLCQGSPITCRR